MVQSHRRLWRTLITGAAAATLAFGSLLGSAPAWARVHVDADDSVQGTSATVTFRVSNESDSGSPTTGLTVLLPNLTSVSTQTTPGWSVKLDRDPAAGTVRSITWSAAPGGGVPGGQFGLFVMRAQLPNTPTVSLPATQTYADGTVVRWDQAPLPGGGEPERPAPMLTLAPAAPGPAVPPAGQALPPMPPAPDAPLPPPPPPAPPANGGPDNVARVLAGIALLLAAAGVGLALVRRRA